MTLSIILGLVLLVGLFLIMASLQSDEMRVTRRITLAAPAAPAFDQINDVHKWQEISPYVKYDPACKTTFSGPAAGVGACFAWAGNSKVGEGRMTISDSRPHELIRFKLEFFKPWQCTNTAEFTFRATGTQTEVTWTMFGKKNFICKAMSLVMNMDKMIGRDFAEGLANLKRLVEGTAQTVGPR